MHLLSKFNKGVRFLLCVFYIYSKYAWVIPLKDKKGITITKQGSKFYNKSMTSWLEKNDIEMYSRHNEGKSVFAEKFLRTLKNKIYNTSLHYQKISILIN